MITEVDGPVWIPSLPPSLSEYLSFNLQPYPVIPVIGLVMAVLYTAGAVRVWRSGRHWSVLATLSFLSGCAVLVVVMGAGIEGYGYELFSVFMFQQLTLMMAIPPLLILGSPGTLMLRALPHNSLGRAVGGSSRRFLRSRAGHIALHPVLNIPLFLMAFYGLYLTDLGSTMLGTWVGHLGLELAFLVMGILFTVPILSRDPLPKSHSPGGRAVHMFAEMPLHAFFGVIVMMSPAVLLATFANPPSSWGIDVLGDQQTAGALAWSYGELPSLILLLIVFVRWRKFDEQTSRAKDVEIAREGNTELDDYNAYLESLAARGDGHPGPGARSTADALD